MKHWSEVLSSWLKFSLLSCLICPRGEAPHFCQAMAPTDLRLVDKQVPVTHILGRCLRVLVFVTKKSLRLEAEGGKHHQLRDLAKPFLRCTQHKWEVLGVQPSVSPAHWGKRKLVADNLRGDTSWLFYREKTRRTKRGLGWKGGKSVIMFYCRISTYNGSLVSGYLFFMFVFGRGFIHCF